MKVDSPDVVIAKQLLDQAKLRGFEFRRASPGEHGPLLGHRVSGDWMDVVHNAGFSHDCLAVRQPIREDDVTSNNEDDARLCPR